MQLIGVRDRTVMPDTTLYMQAGDLFYTGGSLPEAGEQVLLVPMPENTWEKEQAEDRLYPIGVIAAVTDCMFQDYVAFVTSSRMIWSDLQEEADGRLYADGSIIAEKDMVEPFRAGMQFARLLDSYTGFLDQVQGGEVFKKHVLPKLRSVTDLFCTLTIWFHFDEEDRLYLLGEDSEKKRYERMEKLLREALASMELSHGGAVERVIENERNYRETAIRKQIAFLEKQLDEMHPEGMSDIRLFEKRLGESGMNEAAMKESRRVLSRLKQENDHSPEFGLLSDYLDFMTTLSWKAPEWQPIDLEEARKRLEQDHYGLKDAKNRVIEQIAVMNLTGKVSGSILLFVGSPGTGKTSIGKSIADAMHRSYARVSLGGVRDEADIRGHRRTYIGAMPGRIMDAIHKCGVSNPVMVLDEVDKLCQSMQGDPASALLEVLDPEQNSTFTDHYLNVPYDLSHVFFICTANTTSTIPEPLLNRMEVIRFPGYTPLEKVEIGKRHLLPRAMDAVGLKKKNLVLKKGVMEKIVSEYTAEAGVRALRKRLDAICRQAAVKSWEQNGKRLMVTEKNLREYLDDHPIRHNRVPESQRPGVVTGLAWTAAGGEILFIETAFTEGSGQIVLTGQLGDVMKESARIAISLVRMQVPEQSEKFSKTDVHIHVPSGSIPKDGPSAGVTMFTALLSLVTGKPVDPHLAMTGEITLTGKVTAIGGLPEKLMAAHRAGVKKVLVPKENEEDLEDVPEEIRNLLDIHLVEHLEDVIRETGL